MTEPYTAEELEALEKVARQAAEKPFARYRDRLRRACDPATVLRLIDQLKAQATVREPVACTQQWRKAELRQMLLEAVRIEDDSEEWEGPCPRVVISEKAFETLFRNLYPAPLAHPSPEPDHLKDGREVELNWAEGLVPALRERADRGRISDDELAALSPRSLEGMEEIARIIYEANPCGDQEVDADYRPAGPGYIVPWERLHEYDAGIYDSVMQTARTIYAGIDGR